MAYLIDQTGDLVINGWADGIADSAEMGISRMQGMNIITRPNEACVNFATTPVSIPPISVIGASATFNAATDTVTWSVSDPIYNGTAIVFGSSSGGVTAGITYWAGNVSGSTFKVYNAINASDPSNLVDLTANTSNTFSTQVFALATQYTLDYVNNYVFLIDNAGKAWWINASGNLIFLGNDTRANAHGNGICVYNGFIFVFRDTIIDYLPVDAVTNTSSTASQWAYAWQTGLASNLIHQAISAQDNAMYFCCNTTVGSVLTNAGSSFDPTSSGSYSYNTSALQLPATDRATYIAELGTNLLIGGIINRVYPWDRLSTSFQYPIILAENYTSKIVSTNSNSYIFAGNRGRIYITNGSNVEVYKKIPDSITNFPDPYFTWGGAIYWKNQLYFTLQATANNGTSTAAINGLYAIDVTSNAFRNTNLIISSTLAGSTPVIIPNIRSTTPAGAGIYMCYTNTGQTVFGIDVTATTPYTSVGQAFIDTDLIPVGTFLRKKTYKQIEFKLAAALVAGESIQISARASLSDLFVLVGSTNTVGAISDVYTVNFEKFQWLQLRIEPVSTASSPSYVRLTEVRVR